MMGQYTRTSMSMGILTADMKRIVEEQRLGFVATVCPDGTPNLSPKGTTTIWDDDHLVFANIKSPGTLANLRQNASVEVNVAEDQVRDRWEQHFDSLRTGRKGAPTEV